MTNHSYKIRKQTHRLSAFCPRVLPFATSTIFYVGNCFLAHLQDGCPMNVKVASVRQRRSYCPRHYSPAFFFLMEVLSLSPPSIAPVPRVRRTPDLSSCMFAVLLSSPAWFFATANKTKNRGNANIFLFLPPNNFVTASVTSGFWLVAWKLPRVRCRYFYGSHLPVHLRPAWMSPPRHAPT